MYTINFTFEQPGLKPLTLEHVEGGQTLLEVALNHNIVLHHQCGGICSCSTCHLYVHRGGEHLEEMSRREKIFVDRAIRPRPDSRLACQSLLPEGSGTIQVTVPDQSQF